MHMLNTKILFWKKWLHEFYLSCLSPLDWSKAMCMLMLEKNFATELYPKISSY